MFKITSKTTKQELANVLGANAKTVKEQDKNLYDQMAYTSDMMKKDEKKVTRRDLVDLVKDVMKALGDKFVEPALAEEKTPAPVQPQAENAVKKLKGGVTKAKEEPVKEESTEEQGAKAPKKSLGKKTEKKSKEGVTVLADSDKTVQMAEKFPTKLSVNGNTYELATDIKTMDDLFTALENEEGLVFAYYWTKRHLKQFPYFNGWLGQPKSFDNDLDLASTIFVSDSKSVAYNVSLYTDAIYSILPTDLEEVDGLRFCDGMEYQIYRVVE